MGCWSVTSVVVQSLIFVHLAAVNDRYNNTNIPGSREPGTSTKGHFMMVRQSSKILEFLQWNQVRRRVEASCIQRAAASKRPLKSTDVFRFVPVSVSWNTNFPAYPLQ